MPEQPKRQDPSRRLSSSSQAELRDKLVRQEIEKERAASAAKTAKLRALRLAKEAAEKEAADKRAQEKATAKANAEASRRKRTQEG